MPEIVVYVIEHLHCVIFVHLLCSMAEQATTFVEVKLTQVAVSSMA